MLHALHRDDRSRAFSQGIAALAAARAGGVCGDAAPATASDAAAPGELAALRAQLEAARAEADRWRALHGELRGLVADQH